ncbi:MAG: MBL fold metallo-hydrolase, partial [Oceanisphaera sp.]|nr:MBL fold metallo-hydrolase [Oceanisphaera sp.]
MGRIPWLIAAGFRGPIYCTEPTAALLPLVLEDALGIHIPNNADLVEKALARIVSQIQPVPYNQWHPLPGDQTELRFQPAGHIMGSAYVELETHGHRTVFSGDLGASGAVFVDPPQAPERADILVLESTYGNRDHEARAERKTELGNSLKRALADGGTVLIPAFSLGRTQEILAFIEDLLHEQNLIHPDGTSALPIILDSPLALRMTQAYRHLVNHWREPLQSKREAGRFPLAFDQLITVENHNDHLAMVKRLTSTQQPAVVLAASGMCQGGRIMNYLEAMLPLKETDVFFVGYQAKGTLGAAIQSGQPGDTVRVNHRPTPMNSQVHRLSGFSAHADRTG